MLFELKEMATEIYAVPVPHVMKATWHGLSVRAQLVGCQASSISTCPQLW